MKPGLPAPCSHATAPKSQQQGEGEHSVPFVESKLEKRELDNARYTEQRSSLERSKSAPNKAGNTHAGIGACAAPKQAHRNAERNREPRRAHETALCTSTRQVRPRHAWHAHTSPGRRTKQQRSHTLTNPNRARRPRPWLQLGEQIYNA